MSCVRVHVLSDLHIERGVGEVPRLDVDVVVLAGDIGIGTDGVRWAGQWAQGTPIVYVAGNHEFYGHSIEHLGGQLRAAASGSTVHVLDDSEVTIGGVRFLGCTLWSDFDFDGPDHRELSMRVCERAVSDYSLIRGPGEGPLTAQYTRDRHLASRAWLADRLTDGHAGPTVVVTHHSPHVSYRPPEVALRLIAGAFASDLADLMARERALLWIYGHTHRRADLRVSGTRVVSNPRGYPDEPVAGFDPGLTITVNGA